MPASTPCPICEEPAMAEVSPFCSADCLHASPSTAKSKDILRRLERFEGRSAGEGGPGGMVSVGPEVPRNLSLYLAGAQDEAAFLAEDIPETDSYGLRHDLGLQLGTLYAGWKSYERRVAGQHPEAEQYLQKWVAAFEALVGDVKSPHGRAPHGSAQDGTGALCRELYGRNAAPPDYIGGSEASMLYDAASEISRLKKELNSSSKAQLQFEVIISSDLGGTHVMVRALLDGALVVTAGVEQDYLHRSQTEFGRSREQVVQELKYALLDEVKRIRNRVTIVETKVSGDNSAIHIARALVSKQSHTTGVFLTYDFSTGETGPEDVDEYIRNSFRRSVHEHVLERVSNE